MPACMLEYMSAACVSCVCVCASLCVIEWVWTMHVHVCARVCVRTSADAGLCHLPLLYVCMHAR